MKSSPVQREDRKMAVTISSLVNNLDFDLPLLEQASFFETEFSRIKDPKDQGFYHPDHYQRSILIRYLADQGYLPPYIFEQVRAIEKSIYHQHGEWPCERPVYPSDIEKTLRPVEKVRHGSYESGSIEPLIWKAFNPHTKWALKKAVRNYLLEEGASPNAYFVYEELLDLIDYETGRLDPSIAYLAEKLHKGERTIQRCLNWLRDNNIICWKRRFIRKQNEDGISYREQTSNAYYLGIFRNLPESIKDGYHTAMKKALGESPLPDDELYRIEQANIEYEEMVASLPEEEWVEVALLDNGGKSELKETLASLGAAIDKKEAANKNQSKTPQIRDDSPLRQNGHLSIYNYYFNNGKSSNDSDPPPLDPRFAPEWQVHKLLAQGISAQHINKIRQYQTDRIARKLPILDLLHSADLMKKIRLLE